MSKFIYLSTMGIIGLALFVGSPAFAQVQGIRGLSQTTADGHTAREEAEGRVVWEKLQAKQVKCSDLSNDDFGVLGEYFMGRMAGVSHEAMNTMMTQMMGEAGERQMHIVMGKRLSGCDTSAAFPSEGIGFMPMMNMMMGGWSTPFGNNQLNNSMMSFGYTPFGFLGWFWMIFWWVIIIVAIVFLVRWIARQGRGGGEKSALDILKERYAKGEIDKKEYEEKKKDLA